MFSCFNARTLIVSTDKLPTSRRRAQSTTDNGAVADLYDTVVFMIAVGITPLRIQYQ